MIPFALLVAPWGVGPAPSAHDVLPGPELAVAASGIVGGPSNVAGGEVGFAYGVGPRLWMSVAGQAGSSWSTCPDCRTLAGTATARGVLVRHPNVQLAPWVVATSTLGAGDLTAGVAVEGGGERLRVDTSWPVWWTSDLLTTLRITPELGVSYQWSDTQHTRIAAAGLDPAVAVQHRARIGEGWTAEGTVRLGEEGLGLEGAVRWRF